jgi:hypothetical protein
MDPEGLLPCPQVSATGPSPGLHTPTTTYACVIRVVTVPSPILTIQLLTAAGEQTSPLLGLG